MAVLQDPMIWVDNKIHHIQFRTTSESTQLRAKGFCSREGGDAAERKSAVARKL